MTGKRARRQGRDGETEAKNILLSRDWVIADLSSGLSCEDLLGTDPDGISWSIEVKATAAITIKHREQAMRQAEKRKARWMLMSKILQTSSFLVQRQGHMPTVWRMSYE